MAQVEVDIYKHGRVARGMAYPIKTADLVSCFVHRAEPRVYLDISFRDDVKKWSKRGAADRLKLDALLLSVRFDRGWNEWNQASWRSSILQQPDWVYEENPNRLTIDVHSLPSEVMRESGLTREWLASLLPGHVARLFPGRINADNVMMEYALDAKKREVLATWWARPVRRWEKQRTERLPIGATGV